MKAKKSSEGNKLVAIIGDEVNQKSINLGHCNRIPFNRNWREKRKRLNQLSYR